MNKTFLFIGVLSMVFTACQDNHEQELNSAKALYAAALEYQDATTAKVALVQLVRLDSTNIAYKDSLARILIRGGNYQAGTVLAETVMNAQRADNKLLEMAGVAYQQILRPDRATSLFDDLFNKTGDYRYAYQVAAISLEIGNTADFDTLTNQLLAKAQNDSVVAQTLIDFPGPVTGNAQYIPIEAATLFLKGKYAMDKEQDIGKTAYYFREALGLYPNFELPYYYLQEIENQARSQRR